MSQLTADAGAAYEDDVVLLTVPADGTYLAVLRTATAGLAARLHFALDEIEDLRIAVDEACAMLLAVAARDTELAGFAIPAGSAVMPMLGAANHDEERYPDPDRFDIFRAPKPHISWGHGVHLCLGMHLARLEMRVALELLLDRLPGLRLDPEGKDPHIRGQVFRSPTALPVRFGPRST